MSVRELTRPNDEFQLLRALLSNRTKRRRLDGFLIHGVRPINAAIAARWPLKSLLIGDTASSRWAHDLQREADVAEILRLPAPLMDELGERDEGAEVIAVGRLRTAPLAALAGGDRGPVVVAEGIQSPGNVGTIFRSAEALGASGLVVTGHAADPYDPKSVRASTGAMFSLPFAEAASVGEVAEAIPGRFIGLDPDGDPLDDVDLSGDIVLVAGSESRGLSNKGRAHCAVTASIPMTGSVDSLNIATAVAIVLAEVARRRR